jgi:hypothetical protein
MTVVDSWSILDMILHCTDEFGYRLDQMVHLMTPIIQVHRLLLFPRNTINSKILHRRMIQSDSRRLTGIHRRLLLVRHPFLPFHSFFELLMIIFNHCHTRKENTHTLTGLVSFSFSPLLFILKNLLRQLPLGVE